VLDTRTQRYKDDLPGLHDNHMLGRPSLDPINHPGQLQRLLDWLTEQQDKRGNMPKVIVTSSVFVPNDMTERIAPAPPQIPDDRLPHRDEVVDPLDQLFGVNPDGTVSTIAGNGQSGFANGRGGDARFNNPTGLIVGADGTIYVADRNNHRIRVISPAGEATTIAGDGTEGFQDAAGPAAKFNRPIDIVLTPDGALMVSEENNHRLRKVILR
jgi:hypothetical protein